jgi:hypothetical protein
MTSGYRGEFDSTICETANGKTTRKALVRVSDKRDANDISIFTADDSERKSLWEMIVIHRNRTAVHDVIGVRLVAVAMFAGPLFGGVLGFILSKLFGS